jgi:flagellar protein FlaG
MNVPFITTPGRIADLAGQANLPQGPPPRPVPVAAERPAIKPPANAVSAGNETVRTRGEPNPQLESELDSANRKLADAGHQLRFEYDRDANELIVRLIDLGTNKVLRQYPSDEALRVARLVKSDKPLITMRA